MLKLFITRYGQTLSLQAAKRHIVIYLFVPTLMAGCSEFDDTNTLKIT